MRNVHVDLDFDVFHSVVAGGLSQYLRASATHSL